ncbi:MAG: DNA translocase FtsK [Planctomycetota bacterium]|nr:DNA translocase FtsK [Planctomycetota bacterium]
MSANKSKGVSAAEWLGLFVLFLPGSFFFVVLGAALVRGVPPEPAGTSALARDVMNGIGLWPALLLSVGFAVVGIRSFLFGRGMDVLASVLGLAGCAAGLAILLGATSAGGGGALGSVIDGLLGETAGAPVGVALGAASLAASAWFAWIRDFDWFSAKTWNFRWVSAAPREECADAVTADEAQALLPTRQTYEPEIDGNEGVRQEPSSPYPTDVRLQGEVPAGAQAFGSDLGNDDGFERTSTSASEVAALQSGAEEDGSSPVDAPGEHLAAGEAEELEAGDHADARADAPSDEELSEGESGASRLLDPTPPLPSWERKGNAEDDELEGAADLDEDLDEPDELDDAAELDEDDTEGDEPAEADGEEESGEDCQRDLFGEPVTEPIEPAEPDPPAERELVLEPQPAPETGAELLMKAGCLFLERERVAVSMLQRGFDLSFDQSCKILDELQERGLIGPYMGGKSREILMNREEWLALADDS